VYVNGKDAVADEGAIFGAWVAELREQRRVCAFDHPKDGVYTSWDLGHGDSTAIWFWRLNTSGALDVIDHYENHGEGLSHYFRVVDDRGYKYLKHWLPHDAKQKTLATQLSVLEQCAEHWGVGAVAIGPQLSVMDGIHATRWALEQPTTRIHERCGLVSNMPYSGLEALEGYRWSWNELLQCYSREPVHNWASHTSDAFRGMACVIRFTDRMTRPPPETKPAAAPVGRPITLDKLWEDNEREERKRI
jgi:phage terminase large subunit